ncbi:MAG TPA: DUF4402 domain-containing protein [Bacteroidales bacterium]|nr:DUF4402 domain-containing protein [Bacteroidales bacterium]
MKIVKCKGFGRMGFVMRMLSFIILLALSLEAMSQEPPPRPIRIDATAQFLSFGAFYHGAIGGSVIIDPSGSRSSTGDVVLLGLGYPFSAAMFEVHANPGTVISILNGPDVSLPGTPSGSMTLHIGSSSPASPFVSTVLFDVAIPLYIGGTLTVGNSAANPPGSYSGTFDITLVQE